MDERLAELRELQDDITAPRRDELIGATVEVLVDAPGVGRTPPRGAGDRRHRARRGMISPWASSPTVEIVDALGPDLVAAGAAVGGDGRRR